VPVESPQFLFDESTPSYLMDGDYVLHGHAAYASPSGEHLSTRSYNVPSILIEDADQRQQDFPMPYRLRAGSSEQQSKDSSFSESKLRTAPVNPS
jgi:hypothetical protein